MHQFTRAIYDERYAPGERGRGTEGERDARVCFSPVTEETYARIGKRERERDVKTRREKGLR